MSGVSHPTPSGVTLWGNTDSQLAQDSPGHAMPVIQPCPAAKTHQRPPLGECLPGHLGPEYTPGTAGAEWVSSIYQGPATFMTTFKNNS